jgi:hypothetical protein
LAIGFQKIIRKKIAGEKILFEGGIVPEIR